MNILIDAHLSEDRITGVGRYLNGLIEALKALDHENTYHVLVSDYIADGHALLGLKAENWQLIRSTLSGPSLRQHTALPAVIRKIRPDIYHHPHFDLPVMVGCNSVITVHDLKYIRHPEFFPEKGRLKAGYIKIILKRSLRHAKRIIAVSEATKQDLIRMYSIDPGRIAVIHHGLSSCSQKGEDCSGDAMRLKRLGIKLPYILFVGERRPHKNIPRLIRAFKELTRSEPGLQLVIAGKAYKDYNDPELVVQNNHLDGKVNIAGYIAESDLPALYRNAEMCILPSLYEGFGFPLLEAMGYSTPVLGSDLSSIPEVIGDAGLLFDPMDIKSISRAMMNLLKDCRLRQTLISRGVLRSAQFTWEKTAQKTLRLYEAIFQSSSLK